MKWSSVGTGSCLFSPRIDGVNFRELLACVETLWRVLCLQMFLTSTIRGKQGTATYCGCTSRAWVVLFRSLSCIFARAVGGAEDSTTVRKWCRFVIFCVVVSQIVLIYLYWYSEEPLIAPYYGICPAPLFVGLIPCLFGLFSDSHPMFRWIFGGGHLRCTFSLIHIRHFSPNQWLSCDGNECNPMYT